MKYTQEQLSKIVDELSEVKRSQRATSRSHMFAKDAHQAIVNVYNRNWETKVWSERENVSEAKVQKANDLMDAALNNGVDHVVYGAGRVIVQRKA